MERGGAASGEKSVRAIYIVERGDFDFSFPPTDFLGPRRHRGIASAFIRACHQYQSSIEKLMNNKIGGVNIEGYTSCMTFMDFRLRVGIIHVPTNSYNPPVVPCRPSISWSRAYHSLVPFHRPHRRVRIA